jgi:hypothetical protein
MNVLSIMPPTKIQRDVLEKINSLNGKLDKVKREKKIHKLHRIASCVTAAGLVVSAIGTVATGGPLLGPALAPFVLGFMAYSHFCYTKSINSKSRRR